MKLPKTVGTTVDLWYRTRERRLELKKEIDDLKDEEHTLLSHALKMLNKSKLERATGKVANATRVSRYVHRAVAWDDVYKYVKKHNAFDVFQRRLNGQAIMDRIEDGKPVPGIKTEKIITLILTKR